MWFDIPPKPTNWKLWENDEYSFILKIYTCIINLRTQYEGYLYPIITEVWASIHRKA